MLFVSLLPFSLPAECTLGARSSATHCNTKLCFVLLLAGMFDAVACLHSICFGHLAIVPRNHALKFSCSAFSNRPIHQLTSPSMTCCPHCNGTTILSPLPPVSAVCHKHVSIVIKVFILMVSLCCSAASESISEPHSSGGCLKQLSLSVQVWQAHSEQYPSRLRPLLVSVLTYRPIIMCTQALIH